jgi:surface antigen
MTLRLSASALAAFIALASPAFADSAPYAGDFSNGASLPSYLQCVPYARRVSGISIYGDAHTWWDQAEGRYARGKSPRVGAVMAFPAYGNMRLGHVATVSQIVDSRTVLLRHANWSPINGTRGQIEDNVRAIDVSPGNDWSEVRVWYAPLGGLGTTHYPVQGFIYNQKSAGGSTVIASARSTGNSDPIGEIIARHSRLALNR